MLRISLEKLSPYDMESPRDKLLAKSCYIMITNRCNLKCGGCNQFCPNFNHDQIFDVDLGDIQKHIVLLSRYRSSMVLHGGEPTLHPKWSAIIKILQKHQKCRFVVLTNRYRNPEQNIYYHEDNKDNLENRKNRFYHPTLVAPIDLLNNKCHDYYWDLAQKTCGLWRGGAVIIYNKKAFFCEVAAAMNQLFGEDYGWQIDDRYPFAKTNNEIAEQASHFCYRCGWNLPYGLHFNQSILSPTLASETNMNALKHKKFVKLYVTAKTHGGL